MIDNNCGDPRVAAEPDDVTRVVRHGCITVAGRVYTHPILSAREGRRVLLRRVGDDSRQAQVFLSVSCAANAQDRTVILDGLVGQDQVRGDITICRNRPKDTR